MPIVGPHFVFTCFLRRREVHGVGGTQDEVPRGSQHERAGPSQHAFRDRYEIPQPITDVSGEVRGQFGRIGAGA